MSVGSLMKILSQPLPVSVFSFSQPMAAPRGSVRRTEQTRKPIPTGTVNE